MSVELAETRDRPTRSNADLAYQMIRERLVMLDIRPSEPINDEGLARQLGSGEHRRARRSSASSGTGWSSRVPAAGRSPPRSTSPIWRTSRRSDASSNRWSRPVNVAEHIVEHVALLRAIVDGDADLAAKLTLDHFVGFEQAVRAVL